MSLLDRITGKKSTAAKASKTSSRPKKRATAASLADLGMHLVPHITEKASALESQQVYTFRVASRVGKLEVVSAIRARYGVTPIAVRMLRVAGKEKRFGQMMGTRPDWKKAYVTLAKGDSITIAKPTIADADVEAASETKADMTKEEGK